MRPEWLVVAALAAFTLQAQTIYVSPNGNDAWSGRLAEPNAQGTDGPLRSLRAGQLKARETRAREVVLRDGAYRIAEPLVFAPEDSGVTWTAYHGERPIISGGRVIAGWKAESGGLWSAGAIPEVRDGKWLFRSLFLNGRRLRRARSPNNGFYRVDGPSPEGRPIRLKYRNEEILPAWAERADVEVVALLSWADVRMPIRQVDRAAHTATLAAGSQPSNKEADARYWIENAPEALDAPGEWYLDRRSGVLRYRPMAGESLETAEFVAPVLTQLARIDGRPEQSKPVRDLVFRGLTFRDADWDIGPDGYADVQAAVEIGSAITATGAVNCAFERCRIAGVGGHALHLGLGCQRNRVERCEFTDLGAGAIRIGTAQGAAAAGESAGGGAAREARGNQITDNRMEDGGVVFPSAVAIWLGPLAYDTRIAHNEIRDFNYTGISVCWTWGYAANPCGGHVIEYNHIHHIGRNMLSDLGAIYTLGAQPGTVIRNNLIHDVSAFAYGGWGIYLDEGSAGILVENNVVYRTRSAGFVLHYGRDNTVRNNIFAYGDEFQFWIGRPENHIGVRATNNILLWNRGLLFGGAMQPDPGLPQCARPLEGTGVQKGGECRAYFLDRNLYWDERGTVLLRGKTFASWRRGGQDAHSIIADPRFVNVAADRFDLSPDSPALRLGFRPIDVSTAGPRPDQAARK